MKGPSLYQLLCFFLGVPGTTNKKKEGFWLPEGWVESIMTSIAPTKISRPMNAESLIFWTTIGSFSNQWLGPVTMRTFSGKHAEAKYVFWSLDLDQLRINILKYWSDTYSGWPYKSNVCHSIRKFIQSFGLTSLGVPLTAEVHHAWSLICLVCRRPASCCCFGIN